MNIYIKEKIYGTYEKGKFNLPLRLNIQPGNKVRLDGTIYKVDKVSYTRHGKEVYLSRMYL